MPGTITGVGDTAVNCEGGRKRFTIFYFEFLDMSRNNLSSPRIGFLILK